MNETVIGIDMGGTNLRAAAIQNFNIKTQRAVKVHSRGTADDVLNQLFAIVDTIIDDSVAAIGVGIAGLVNQHEKMVYDVVYIPSWKKIPLQSLLEERYHVPVFVNNDSNCFALGEYYFGKGKGSTDMVGVTIGTGLGCGLIIRKKLFEGKNGGAGEFGMISYLDKTVEYYASGQFFDNVYHISGEQVYQRALDGDAAALEMYGQMGFHLGNAINNILYAFDTDLIVLGGSVSRAYSFFAKKMWQQIDTFGFRNALKNLRIELSELENAGMLGAAALFFDDQKETKASGIK